MMFLLMQVTEVKTKKTGTKRTAPEHRIPCAFPLAVCWRVFLLDFSLSNSFSGLLSLTGIEIYSSELRVDSTALVFSIYFSPKHFLYISDSWKGIDQTFPPQKRLMHLLPCTSFLRKDRASHLQAVLHLWMQAGIRGLPQTTPHPRSPSFGPGCSSLCLSLWLDCTVLT